MPTREEITETIKAQFANVRERGRILAQALRARADIAATRRRLRATFADLGEEVYERMAAGPDQGWSDDADLAAYKARIEGLKAELGQREKALKEILEGREKKVEEQTEEDSAAPAEEETR